ncbi:hypothetical protein [Rhodoglobus aureus]|uniref:ATP-binding protein n=1 Tax=Rhodoglobus aureus TaxID=191497 RepID=A0ABP4G5D2_9MICO
MGSENVKKQSESKVPFDISRAPLGFRAASALVCELSKLDDRFERHYLEIKSDIDPSKNELAKIAKYILGSANRMPERAATAFEGYGVLVIGVAPGKITGVPSIEILEIDKVVSAYIGPNGPQWDLIHVPVVDSTNTVLVILVDPPQDGQDAFICRKEGDNLMNGRIYFRADGETREARASEVDLLLERGKRSAAAEIGFDVEVLGYANPVEIDEQRTLETHILNTVEGLLRALPQPEPKPKSILTDDGKRQRETERKTALETGRLDASLNPSSVSALSEALKPSLAAADAMSQQIKPHQTAMANMAGELAVLQKSSALNSFNITDPEKRTEEQYRKAIEQWEGKLRKAWPQAVGTLTAYALDAVSIRVKNKAKTFFRDLELKIHVEGDIDGLDWLDGSDGSSAHRLDLPEPPRVWGPTQRSMVGRDFFQPQYMQYTSVPSMYRSPLNWKNGGSVDVTLKVGELRPLGEYLFDDEELVLVLPLTRDSRVKGTWQITASGHDEIYAGELQVEVGPPVDLTKLMRRLLLLDSN